MERRLINDELRRTWKEAILAMALNLAGRTENSQTSSVRRAGIPAEIRIEHLLHGSPERFRYISLLGNLMSSASEL
jgi:hypothetical protein